MMLSVDVDVLWARVPGLSTLTALSDAVMHVVWCAMSRVGRARLGSLL